MKKKLPIGIDNFEKIRDNDYYYVDKTLMIKFVHTPLYHSIIIYY